jgi:hypothetical protein
MPRKGLRLTTSSLQLERNFVRADCGSAKLGLVCRSSLGRRAGDQPPTFVAGYVGNIYGKFLPCHVGNVPEPPFDILMVYRECNRTGIEVWHNDADRRFQESVGFSLSAWHTISVAPPDGEYAQCAHPGGTTDLAHQSDFRFEQPFPTNLSYLLHMTSGISYPEQQRYRCR